VLGGTRSEAEAQVLGVRDSLGEEHADVIVMERIDDAPALALADDEPEMTQHPKLLGDC
jgi:hypothetical protein